MNTDWLAKRARDKVSHLQLPKLCESPQPRYGTRAFPCPVSKAWNKVLGVKNRRTNTQRDSGHLFKRKCQDLFRNHQVKYYIGEGGRGCLLSARSEIKLLAPVAE